MKNSRRSFLKLAGMGGVGFAGAGIISGFSTGPGKTTLSKINLMQTNNKEYHNLIGPYGPWASSLNGGKLPAFSFRRKEFSDIEAWRKSANDRLVERLAIPDLGGMPEVKVKAEYTYDGLHIEELVWQLPYGRPTEAILLKPLNIKGKLPGILAFHDHGGHKYFGKRKITRTADSRHPLMEAHQQKHYDNLAWANEAAKRGYVVLVNDAFPFASRRVMLQDVPEGLRQGLNDQDAENAENIIAYNQWAGRHESVMAKSLFSAGTTWPGVFFAEDQKALDILCARDDVDENRIGCGGLSGGGMRTVFMGGLDPRIKCAVCVGFMTTWKDFVLNKSSEHTWMTFVPITPNELDFPEILALRTPLPTLVLNTNEDHLYSLEGMKEADNIFQKIYKKADAPDHYRGSFHPGGHKFDKPMQKEAFDWFDRWLKA
jgi:dienelactone hydrolase